MGRVQDKVCIVTGAASNPGLGRTTAMTLAREGAKVVISDIDEKGLAATAKDIEAEGGTVLALRQDASSEDDWKKVIAETVKKFGRLDVLVNNAGIAVLKPFDELTLADFELQNKVNLTGPFLGMKYALPELRKAGGGSIINLSSVAGQVGLATCAAYAASKGGLRIMSKAVAAEVAEDNIRINTVHPGVIWTNMQKAARGTDAPEDPSTVEVGTGVPLGYAGEPHDIANMILFLASDEARYCTGAEFTVDGGMTAV